MLELESVNEIRERHKKRMDGNTTIPYGIAKGEGIDTKGLSPKEVWKILKKMGYSPKAAYKALTEGKTGKQIAKASLIRNNDRGKIKKGE